MAEPKTQAPVQKETPEVSQEQETVPTAPQQNSDSVSISTSQPEPVQKHRRRKSRRHMLARY